MEEISNVGPSNDQRTNKMNYSVHINDLPELVLHNILSFLDTKEVVQTSVIAKRWRNLWKFQPIVYFDHSAWGKITVETNEFEVAEEENMYRVDCKQEFMDFVDEVLFVSEGPRRCKFYLNAGFYCKENYLYRWIIEIVRQRAEEIYLELAPVIVLEPDGSFPPYVPLELPDCLFTSAIKVFMLQVDSMHIDFTYQLPQSMSTTSHLKRLHLASARLPKGDSRGEFVLKCQVLEILELVDCDYAHINLLTISSPQLKRFIVENGKWGREGSCKIKMNTPSLVFFKCNANFKDYILENVSSLSLAFIRLIGHEEMPQKSYINLLSGIRSATMLDLFGRWLSKSSLENLSEGLTCAFPNLEILKIEWFPDSRIDLVVNLLKKSPCLETLIFKFYQDEKIIDWGEDLSLGCAFDHLKSIEIKDYNDRENEYKFLEFLVRSAMVLENIRIVVNVEISRDEELVELRKKLQALPKASSTASMEIVQVTTPIKYVTLSELETNFNSQLERASIRDGKICLTMGTYQL